MATKSLDTDRGTAAFPHFSPKYKCCCDTIHVKQGTLMISVVTAIIKVVELLHAVISFSEEHLLLSSFYIVHVLTEIICVVLLFVAVLKDRKRFLLPFLFIQVFSVLVYLVVALLCTWTAVDTDNFTGNFFKKEFMSPEEIEIEKTHPEMAGTTLVRLWAIYAATVFILLLCLTLWFLFVVYRCYQYYTDMEKHREPFDTAVSYNAQQGTLVQ
ncbi:unnamed protein product [Cylicocyclus nassatus]|uniref:Uncharacterized protein n=1 Tax=Cylicocyclus nassatus TaxID=53992 RepID=A0AA36HDW0_CYLNA|nr:unnamed protein product [Cylicocyclus nassatus]